MLKRSGRSLVLLSVVCASSSAATGLEGWVDGESAGSVEVKSGDQLLVALPEQDGAWEMQTASGDAVELLLDAPKPAAGGVAEGMAQWERPDIAELLVPAKGGLEHLFFLDAPQAEPKLTIMTLGLSPVLVASDTVHLVDAAGIMRIAYGELFAFDADARAVPAWFDVEGGDIVIHYDDSDASYPIVIDPLAITPAYTHSVGTRLLSPGLSGNGEEGWAVATGNVNGDAWDDLIVSVPMACGPTNCQANEGLIEVYLGSATGPGATPNYVLQSNRTGAQMGRSLAVDDVNNDDCKDIVAGAPALSIGSEFDEGVVFVFKSDLCGGGSGFTKIEVQAGVSGAEMGRSVAIANANTAHAGNEIYVTGYFRVWQIKIAPSPLVATLVAPTVFANETGVVTRLPSIDGDGDDEIAVSLPDAGIVKVLLGASGGPTGFFAPTVTCPSFAGRSIFHDCGRSISAADINGDGRGDLIVSNRTGVTDNTEGLTWKKETDVWLSTASGTFPSSPSSVIVESFLDSGYAVGTLGDLNQDTFEDVAICSDIGVGGAYNGRCRIFAGSALGLESTHRLSIDGSINTERLGNHHGVVAGGRLRNEPMLFDFNRANDLVIGSSRASTGGSTRVWSGSPAGPQYFGGGFTSSSIDLESNESGRKIGAVLLLADLTGDGRDDLISGSPDYLSNKGRVDVWFATAAGSFAATPNWSHTGTSGQLLGTSLALVKTASSGRRLAIGAPGSCSSTSGPTCTCVNCGWVELHTFSGTTVPDEVVDDAVLGTVPGGRFGTTIVSLGNAYGNAAANGLAVSSRNNVVFIHKQNASGLLTFDTGLTAAETCPTQNSQGAFAIALGAGDTNADGRTDLLIGDGDCGGPGGAGVGYAAAFRSTGTTLLTTPFWSSYGPTGKADFGIAVAGVGDVDFDGIADFAVGTPFDQVTPTAPRTGSVRVYRGHASAPLALAPVFGPEEDFGTTIAAGADVNRDRFADVAVGSPSTGLAYVLRGTKTGLTFLTGPAELAVPLLGLGRAMAMGEINVDGYGDVAYGVPLRSTPSTQVNEGGINVTKGVW